MPVQTRYARNKDVTIAYETFGDLATGEPLLLFMGQRAVDQVRLAQEGERVPGPAGPEQAELHHPGHAR